MKSINLILLAALLSVATLFSCKREVLKDNLAPTAKNFSQKIKNWFESSNRVSLKAVNSLAPRGISSNDDPRDGDPVWDATIYFPDTKIFVTPINFKVSEVNKNFITYKYLIATENNTGDIVSGTFFYLTVDNNKTDASFILLLPGKVSEKFFNLQEIPQEYTGTVLTYTLDYGLIQNKTYEHGVELNAKANILSKIDENVFYLTQTDYVLPTNCTSYYLLVTDSEGNIISVTFLFTSCNNEPVGGGGGSTTVCNNTAAAAIAALNGVTYTPINDQTSSILGTTTGPINGIIRAPKNSSVGLITLNFWGAYYSSFTAYFAGVVFKTKPTFPWRWESFNYTYTSMSGGVVPPCFAVTPTVNVSSVISSDKLTASVAVSYQMLVTCSCVGGIQAAPIQSNSFSTSFSSQY